jgi:carboxymethylenebutenolidase
MHFDTITIDTDGTSAFTALVADAPEEAGPKPALILLHEIFGLNGAMRDTARLFAEEGYLVVAPELFWRIEPGVDLGYGEADVAKAMTLYGQYDPIKGLGDIARAVEAARKQPNCNGSVAVLGFCLGGTLAVMASTIEGVAAVVAYYPVALDKVELPRPPSCPVVMHFGAADPYCPPEALAAIRARFADQPVKIFEYANASHAFYNAERPEYAPGSAKVSHTRSLQLLRKQVGPVYDLEALWEQHSYFEFGLRDADRTIGTMVEEPYVNHVPTLTGGVGRKELRHFYKNFFVDVHPEDFEVTVISRTVGVDRLVDEMVATFTHDRMMDYLLPGIAPTGRKVKMAAVGIISFRGSKLFHEHIHYDMGTLLAQVGLLDPKVVSVAGPETAEKVLDRHSHPSNAMMTSWHPPADGGQ